MSCSQSQAVLPCTAKYLPRTNSCKYPYEANLAPPLCSLRSSYSTSPFRLPSLFLCHPINNPSHNPPAPAVKQPLEYLQGSRKVSPKTFQNGFHEICIRPQLSRQCPVGAMNLRLIATPIAFANYPGRLNYQHALIASLTDHRSFHPSILRNITSSTSFRVADLASGTAYGFFLACSIVLLLVDRCY